MVDFMGVKGFTGKARGITLAPEALRVKGADCAPRDVMEARAGIEPAHTGFANQCITTLLPRQALCVRIVNLVRVLRDVNWVKMLLACGGVWGMICAL